MGKRAAISEADGLAAVRAWLSNPDAAQRSVVAAAARYTTGVLATQAPGKAVELRVPPFAAVQCVAGGEHRRGTPRAVVEMSAQVWLELATGQLTWSDAVGAGRVIASGERSDLSAYLPVLNVQ